MIEAVIFDLGNVLIDFDHRIAAERLSGLTGKTGKQIYDLFFDSEITELFEEGKISPGDFFLKIKGKLSLGISYEEFVPIWNEIFFFSERNLAVYNIARAVKERYGVALLSNVNILHFEYVRKTFPIFDAFHHIVTSYEVGARKPAPLIYHKALELLKAAPEEVFYTDDRPELITGAKLLGINSFVFSGVEQLKKDLISAGVNIG